MHRHPHHTSLSLQVEVAAVYVLNEIVHSFTPDNWLRPLQHHSVITILVRRVDHLLAQLSGCEFVEATLVLCLGLARHKEVSTIVPSPTL